MKVFKLANGSKFVAHVGRDQRLYSAPRNPPNTGSKYTAGTDLYVHKTKNNGNQFYTYDWSMWQGTESSYELISFDEAKAFLEEQVGDYWSFPDQDDLEILKEYGINLLEETA